MTENKILKIEIFYLMPLLGESKSKNQILVEHNELLNQKNQNIEHLTKAEKMEDEKQREIINKIRYPHKQSTYRSIIQFGGWYDVSSCALLSRKQKCH